MPFEKEWRQPASSIPTNWFLHRLQLLGFAVKSSVSWCSLVSSGLLVSWLRMWILLSSDPVVWILSSCWLLVLRLLSCCLFAWSKGVRSPSILFQLPYQATWIIRLTQSYKARITFALSSNSCSILPPWSYPMLHHSGITDLLPGCLGSLMVCTLLGDTVLCTSKKCINHLFILYNRPHTVQQASLTCYLPV